MAIPNPITILANQDDLILKFIYDISSDPKRNFCVNFRYAHFLSILIGKSIFEPIKMHKKLCSINLCWKFFIWSIPSFQNAEFRPKHEGPIQGWKQCLTLYLNSLATCDNQKFSKLFKRDCGSNPDPPVRRRKKWKQKKSVKKQNLKRNWRMRKKDFKTKMKNL